MSDFLTPLDRVGAAVADIADVEGVGLGAGRGVEGVVDEGRAPVRQPVGPGAVGGGEIRGIGHPSSVSPRTGAAATNAR